MTTRPQRRAGEPTHSAWTRRLALVCLLIVGWASSAQAVHIHGQWLPHHESRVGAPADAAQVAGGEEHCPLCVALHSALPVELQVDPVQMVLVEQRVPARAGAAPQNLWHFAMFSRPPPATLAQPQ